MSDDEHGIPYFVAAKTSPRGEPWRLEVMPLLLGQGRIVRTDGVFVDAFW